MGGRPNVNPADRAARSARPAPRANAGHNAAPRRSRRYIPTAAAYIRGDYATAIREWLPAAVAGDARAQHVVALMYSIGEGVRQDDVQAYMWIDLAVANYFSQTNMNRAARFRQRIAERMTPAQIFEAQKLAREWKPK